jgi:hypothetical protein
MSFKMERQQILSKKRYNLYAIRFCFKSVFCHGFSIQKNWERKSQQKGCFKKVKQKSMLMRNN